MAWHTGSGANNRLSHQTSPTRSPGAAWGLVSEVPWPQGQEAARRRRRPRGGICLSFNGSGAHAVLTAFAEPACKGAEPGHDAAHLRAQTRARQGPVEARCSSARPARAMRRAEAAPPAALRAGPRGQMRVDARGASSNRGATTRTRCSSRRWGAERSVRGAAIGSGRGDSVPSGVRCPGSGEGGGIFVVYKLVVLCRVRERVGSGRFCRPEFGSTIRFAPKFGSMLPVDGVTRPRGHHRPTHHPTGKICRHRSRGQCTGKR